MEFLLVQFPILLDINFYCNICLDITKISYIIIYITADHLFAHFLDEEIYCCSLDEESKPIAFPWRESLRNLWEYFPLGLSPWAH